LGLEAELSSPLVTDENHDHLNGNKKEDQFMAKSKTGTILKEGMKAPEFRAMASTGAEISLSGLKGKTVVLYFYPMDDTPGCVKEACSFRDAEMKIKALGVKVLGVSLDGLDSHQNFITKFNLNFPLLSDPRGEILDAFGVWKDKAATGATAAGVRRTTFLIDGNGVIRKIWRDVNPEGHAEEVLAEVRNILPQPEAKTAHG
jgi:thioredoxin-dependent peroxiredoxin